MSQGEIKLSDLLGRRIDIDQTPVPRVPGELQHERKMAHERIMYLRRQQQYARPYPDARQNRTASPSSDSSAS